MKEGEAKAHNHKVTAVGEQLESMILVAVGNL